MTYIIRLNVDGSVVECVGQDLLPLAKMEFGDSTDVVTLRHPLADGGGQLVGVIHDWSIQQYEGAINEKAWALYGRSPICGPIFVAYDSYDEPINGEVRPSLTKRFIAAVRQPDFVPSKMMASMNSWLAENNSEGTYRWPGGPA